MINPWLHELKGRMLVYHNIYRLCIFNSSFYTKFLCICSASASLVFYGRDVIYQERITVFIVP